MAEYLSVLQDSYPLGAATQPLLRAKPDRRQVSLGGNRRSTHVHDRQYPYGLLFTALLTAPALLLFAFVTYTLSR